MTELDDLAYRLERGFARRPGDNADWRDPNAMTEALSRLRLAFGDRLAERAGPRVNRSLLAFRMAPQTAGFVDLKLACRGATRAADWEGRRLIDDSRLFDLLLQRVSALEHDHSHWQSCFGGLLAAWLEIRVQSQAARGGEAEQKLEGWLTGHLRQLQAKRGWPLVLISTGRLPSGEEECKTLLSRLN
ncbi:MAG: hypothetical protein ACM3SV_13475 [Betaproteobacteria bacterium]